MALTRDVFKYHFDYHEALKWQAKYTQTKAYIKTNLPAKDAQAYINRDIPRSFFFPKNKFSNDTSHYFYNPWTHIKKAFCFIQGDMDGGSFIQLIWQTFAISTNNLSLIHGDHYNDLRFGYVDDNNARRSLALIFSKDDPSKWMVCITKDTEKPSFAQRSVDIFIPKHLKEKMNITERAERLSQNDLLQIIGKVLGSELLEKKFKTLFDAEGRVRIKKVKAFEKRELKKMGSRYMQAHDVEEPVQRSFASRVFDTLGAMSGGAAGWFVGTYIVGPLLAIPTFGVSLFLAPAVCGLIGGGIGVLLSRVLGGCCCRSSDKVVHPSPDVAPTVEKPSISGGSHTKMARQGVQAVVKNDLVVSRQSESLPDLSSQKRMGAQGDSIPGVVNTNDTVASSPLTPSLGL